MGDFPLDVLNLYCDLVESLERHPTEEELEKAIRKMDSSFFRLNHIGISHLASVLQGRIANRVAYSRNQDTSLQTRGAQAGTAIRLYVDQIDSFARVCGVDPRDVPDVSAMLEADVKSKLAGIIGEPFVPKDSGSEKSDLFTSRLEYEGMRRNPAFLLKGRSVKGIMRIKDLGASGNQILRLLQEPADIFVVQYVGQISTDVVKLLDDQCRLKAIDEHKQLFLTVIDGNDTARILVAYDML